MGSRDLWQAIKYNLYCTPSSVFMFLRMSTSPTSSEILLVGTKEARARDWRGFVPTVVIVNNSWRSFVAYYRVLIHNFTDTGGWEG